MLKNTKNIVPTKKKCIYVTAIKPNFHERSRADNGRNLNMLTKSLANQI